jgi:hypothetical protein
LSSGSSAGNVTLARPERLVQPPASPVDVEPPFRIDQHRPKNRPDVRWSA